MTGYRYPPWAARLPWLNVGCGQHRVDGWWNTDTVSNDLHHPDEITTPGDPFPMCAGMFERAYLGHVLEHVPWPDTLRFLRALRSVLKPGAEVCVVGPDVLRTAHAYRAGHVDDDDLIATMEWSYGHRPDDDVHGHTHVWNCTEGRVVDLLTWAGFAEVTPVALADGQLDRWPLSGRTGLTQCAVIAVNP